MARGLSGFAEGFQGGFGLVNDFYATKAKVKDAEETQAFRREELGLREKMAEDAAEADRIQTQYRKDEMDYRRQKLLIEEGEQADRDADRAEAKKAKAAQDILDKEYHIARMQGLTDAGELNKRKLTAEELVAAKLAKEELNLRNGAHFTRLASLADAGDFSSMQEYLADFSDDIFNPDSHLHLPDLLNPDTNQNFAGLLADFKTIANGGDITEVSSESKAAASMMLMQNRKKMIGQRLDETFVNAPTAYREKGFRIIDSGVSNLQTEMTDVLDAKGNKTGEKKPTITAQAWVELDTGDGTSRFYPASVTKGGEVGKVTPQDMSFDEAGQGMAGMIQLTQFMQKNPLIKTAIEEHMKVRRWGSPEKFERHVSDELAAIYKQVEGFESDADLPENIQSMGFEGNVGRALRNRAEVKAKVVQNALYGPSKRSGAERAKEFFEKVERDFPKITFDPRGGSSRALGQKGVQTLDALLLNGIEDLSITQKLSIGELADNDGHIGGDKLDELLAYLDTQRKEYNLPKIDTTHTPLGAGPHR